MFFLFFIFINHFNKYLLPPAYFQNLRRLRHVSQHFALYIGHC